MRLTRLRSIVGAPAVLKRAASDRREIYRLQCEAEAAQRAGDIGKATELAQMKLDAVRRLHGVAS